MEPPPQVINSGGGAVFQGNVTAGRDITIHNITEIRQVTERLSTRCSTADASEKLLGSLEVLNGAAEFVEDYAKELNASILSGDPQLERVSRECASILDELKRLEDSIENDGNGGYVFTSSLNEDVMDVRSRLMGLQLHLSNINSRKTAKDFDTIKEAVTYLMSNQSGVDDASSIRSFYTASSIPHVERQMWREVEKALRARFPAEFVRDNYALIVASVEELVFENTTSWIPERATLLSKVSSTAATSPPPSDQSNISLGGTIVDTGETTLNDETPWMRPDGGEDPHRTLVLSYVESHPDRSEKWCERVDDGSGECLLTFDGGGVKSWSSILIIEALMRQIADWETHLERQFTHYPRTFNAEDLRPCHYFHKMYGTSTGGILAIALSRLRMTVTQTMHAFHSILSAMYTTSRPTIPLTTKYSHRNLETALVTLVQQNCKQHAPGLCNKVERFPWHSKEKNHLDDAENGDGQQESRSPEDYLCQTICLAATKIGRIDEAYLLRSYDHRYDPTICPSWVVPYSEGSVDLYTWQVGRATTAAPFLFKALEVDLGPPQGFVAFKDGGIRENNPSFCAYSEHESLYGDDIEPSLLLSIGAGQTSASADSASALGLGTLGLSALNKYTKKLTVFKNTLIKYTEGQDRHKTMRAIARGGDRWYRRFEVTEGLERIEMDQWELGLVARIGNFPPIASHGGKTLNTIRTATELYLLRDADKKLNEYAAPSLMLGNTAEKLVRIRRAREFEAMTEGGEKREQWESFMGKHLPGEREFFRKYLEEWDYAMLGRKSSQARKS